MVLGVLVHAGRPLPGLPRFAVSSLHRTVSLAALGFLAVHVITLVSDPFARLGALDTVVPFRAAYRPVWQGLGTVAFDLVLVLVATSLVRHRIGLRTWRVLHTAAYAAGAEGALNVQDPRLGIPWPLTFTDVSERDRAHPHVAANFDGIRP